MKYFHRTSLPLDKVLAAADEFFGSRLQEVERGPRVRRFTGAVGEVGIRVTAEGGHYTHIRGWTDQVGESEADKMVKRFLATVHQRVEPTHQLRGAY